MPPLESAGASLSRLSRFHVNPLPQPGGWIAGVRSDPEMPATLSARPSEAAPRAAPERSQHAFSGRNASPTAMRFFFHWVRFAGRAYR